jgi:DNA-binding response OmpR family regulator
MVKPFGIRELIARVKNILKRAEASKGEIESRALKKDYLFDGIKIAVDEEKHEISMDDNIISLNPKEFQTLSVLLRNINNLTTRNDLIKIVWGENYYGDTRTLDVHIRRIREKMYYNDFGKTYLKTIHGLGYKMIDSIKKI